MITRSPSPSERYTLATLRSKRQRSPLLRSRLLECDRSAIYRESDSTAPAAMERTGTLESRRRPMAGGDAHASTAR